MKWFANQSIRIKVLISSVLFVAVILSLSFYSIYAMKDAEYDMKDLYGDHYQPTMMLNEMLKGILQNRIDMLQILLHAGSANPKDIAEVDKRLRSSAEIRRHNVELWAAFLKKDMNPEERTVSKEFQESLATQRNLFDAFTAAVGKGDIAAAKQVTNDWLVQYHKTHDSMEQLIAHEKKEAEKVMVNNREDTRRTMIIGLTMLSVGLVLSVFITLVLSRTVAKPIMEITAAMQDIAEGEGDLTRRIESAARDEVGQLSRWFNLFAGSIHDIIAQMQVGAQNLAQAVEQISTGNQNLSQRTSEQASSLEEVASTVEEATSAINQNADNAKMGEQLAQNSFSLANNGDAVLASAIATINDINVAGSRISEITAIINDIAFQTNLLALNAAVEAARAGEHGRGFAVVAGEVRNLAQRSASSSGEIDQLIKDITHRIGVGTQQANDSGAALKEIIESVKNVRGTITEILVSSTEQKQGMSQINTAITELDSMTQDNASLVEETAAASEELANQAQELLSLVQRFKVDTRAAVDQQNAVNDRPAPSRIDAAAPRLGGARGTSIAKRRSEAAARPAVANTRMKSDLKDILSNEGFQEF